MNIYIYAEHWNAERAAQLMTNLTLGDALVAACHPPERLYIYYPQDAIYRPSKYPAVIISWVQRTQIIMTKS